MPLPGLCNDRAVSDDCPVAYPKIELHVHFEGTVRPETLLLAARRNDVTLPADTVEGIRDLYRFTDFEHFIATWLLVTAALDRKSVV